MLLFIYEDIQIDNTVQFRRIQTDKETGRQLGLGPVKSDLVRMDGGNKKELNSCLKSLINSLGNNMYCPMGIGYSAAKLFGPGLHFKQADLRAPFIGCYEDTKI
jgi:hypothetical protein